MGRFQGWSFWTALSYTGKKHIILYRMCNFMYRMCNFMCRMCNFVLKLFLRLTSYYVIVVYKIYLCKFGQFNFEIKYGAILGPVV
jgi:hypothetical protein